MRYLFIILLIVVIVLFYDNVKLLSSEALTPQTINDKYKAVLDSQKIRSCVDKKIIPHDSVYKSLTKKLKLNDDAVEKLRYLSAETEISDSEYVASLKYYLTEANSIVEQQKQRRKYLIKLYWNWCQKMT